jgi:hypothetical protein
MGSTCKLWQVRNPKDALAMGSTCELWQVRNRKDALAMGSTCELWQVRNPNDALANGRTCELFVGTKRLTLLDVTQGDADVWHLHPPFTSDSL